MNIKMKQIGTAVAAAALSAFSALAQGSATSLPDARAKIGSVIGDPASMTGVISQLSAADQLSFLSDVNAAIAKMPGSNEEKAAKFLNVNSAALKGAAKHNMANLVAEVFATVPPEALTLINERFAADLFNRSADPSRTYTDEQFVNISTNLLARIERRTAETDDAGVRNAFAIAMLVRASNGSPEGLADTLAATIDDPKDREAARSEWLPAILGEKGDYESMLAYADAGAQPDMPIALRLAGPQLVDALLADVASSLLDEQGRETTPFSDQIFGSLVDATTPSLADEGPQPPRTTDPTRPWNPSYTRRDMKRVKAAPLPPPYEF